MRYISFNQDAKKVLKRMAKTNNRPPFNFKLQKEMDIDNEQFTFVRKTDNEGNRVSISSVNIKTLSMMSKDKMSDMRATALNVSTKM
jgi:hypothetical protein